MVVTFEVNMAALKTIYGARAIFYRGLSHFWPKNISTVPGKAANLTLPNGMLSTS